MTAAFRRLAPALLGFAAWLVLAAAASADGGPHVASVNNGSGGLTSDNCASCHRAHTAPASDLLRVDADALCLSCHDGQGATVDVIDGWQYEPAPAADPAAPGAYEPGDAVLGALRGGGFEFGLIDSSRGSRIIPSLPARPGSALGKVPVLAAAARQSVTSTHLGTGIVWGNGSDGAAGVGPGPVELGCTSCHNPHGNGMYRILRPSVGEDWTATLVVDWAPTFASVEVPDLANPTNATRNYTVLPGALATDVTSYAPEQGDYWRRSIPWSSPTGARDPMERGWDGSSPTASAGRMTAWCISCHTRYSGLVNADGISSSVAPQPDATFTYRHLTMNFGCLQCHVSHGSNAAMAGSYSLGFTAPDGSVPAAVAGAGPAASPVTSGDSRLLKVDNRGTCQMCHDPTGTAPAGYVGPTPTPGTP